ncbi:MAG: hypothetical protein K1000chlam2_00261, partial [Chlamydiae bacterium]|nr:hypothetical protein [Chlamydiota bacterium]
NNIKEINCFHSITNCYSYIINRCPLTIRIRSTFLSNLNETKQQKPHKLLQYCVRLIHAPPEVDLSTIEGEIALAKHKAEISVIKQTLLSEPIFSKLSNYHFVKLICLFPDQLKNQEDFNNALQEFKKDLDASPDDEKMLKRASKISKALLEHDSLSAFASILDPLMTITSYDGSEIKLNRFTWAVGLRAWRPFLLKQISQSGPVGISKEGLEFIGQTFDQNALPRLSYDSLLQVYEEAEHLDYREMKFACTKGLIHEMNEERLMELLEFATKYKDDVLFDACLGFFCGINEINIDISKSNGKYTLKIYELSDRSVIFLKKISKIFNEVKFIQNMVNHKSLNTHKDLIFPNATLIEYESKKNISSRSFQLLGTRCPKARICKITQAEPDEKPESQWGNVEILYLSSPTEFRHKNFPKLKFCCFNTSQAADVTEET